MDRFGNLIEKMILARINTRRVLRYALYMFLSLLAQTMVLNRLRIAGVCPLVLPAGIERLSSVLMAMSIRLARCHNCRRVSSRRLSPPWSTDNRHWLANVVLKW